MVASDPAVSLGTAAASVLAAIQVARHRCEHFNVNIRGTPDAYPFTGSRRRRRVEDLFATLQELEVFHTRPEVRANPEELAKVLANEFFEIGSSGRIFYKSDCVVEGGSGQWDVSMFDFRVHPLAEGVVLTTYRIEDRTRQRNTLRSSIWKLTDGRWQMVFHQGTIMQG